MVPSTLNEPKEPPVAVVGAGWAPYSRVNRMVTLVEHQRLAVTRRSEVSMRGQIRADAVHEIFKPRKTWGGEGKCIRGVSKSVFLT